MNMLSGAGKRYGLKKLTALIIMDGFGCNPDSYGNAIMPQNTKHLRTIWDAYPHTEIGASGRDVGLPSGQMGNSEVGHTNIGAGRVVFQDLTRIFDLAESGRLGSCTAVREAFENCREHSSALHLMGLLSDGGVHSHIDHLFALLDAAKAAGMQKVFVHCFTDGRDTAVDSGLGFVRALKDKLAECGCGKIATVEGRYYAMDRNNNYDRTEKAYSALVYGEGDMFSDAEEAVKTSYQNGVTDEFIKPCVITENGAPIAKINANDSIIFFNFRPDRAPANTLLHRQGFSAVRAQTRLLSGQIRLHEPVLRRIQRQSQPHRSSRTAFKHHGRVSFLSRKNSASHCGNGEIRSCYFLFQRRDRTRFRRRGQDSCSVTERCNI